MANLSLHICDFCKSVVEKEMLDYTLILNRRGNKKKEGQKRGEVCKKCFTRLSIKLEESPNISNFSNWRSDTTPQATKENTSNKVKNNCPHERNSFNAEKGTVTCRDCGLTQPA